MATIRSFTHTDTDAVVSLWQQTGLTRAWNNPYRDIERKLTEDPELFLVMEEKSKLIGTAMFGYDGHRGWLYYLAIDPACQHRGHARKLIAKGEEALRKRGCPKLELMVRDGNAAVIGLYEDLGYERQPVVTLGKRLIED